NLGAMENPGCVTFTESYVYRSAATRAQYQARANTILHEMAHMWFGDLVTPHWWDGLWLKESFADYMGAAASVAATEYTDAWVSFANLRKAWAYTQDQLPTTHPVVADITDLEAAKQNFDGITYAKGAAVLKQLVAYVGEDAFFEGARQYFRRHAYGSTTLPDLLGALEEASGRDLAAWSRLWLETSGTSTLRTERASEDGHLTRLVLVQDAVDPVTGAEVQRPHRLAVGLYALRDDGTPRLVRTHRIELDVTGARTEVVEAAGLDEPALVLVNDDDLTYAKVRLDEQSLTTAAAYLGALREPLPRSLVWSALWNACRDGLLTAVAYVELVLRHGDRESDSAVLAGLTQHAVVAVERYAPAADRDELRAAYAGGVHDLLLAAEAGSDAQLVWARAFARAGAVVPERAQTLCEILAGAVPGLPLDPELRWAVWQALAAIGDATRAELDAELERDATADGATQHLAALSAVPEPEVKAWSWAALLTPDALTNDHVDATIAGFAQPLRRDLTEPYTGRYFLSLRDVWAQHSIEMASRLVRGLFPSHQDLDGQIPEQHPVVVRTDRWLAREADAPHALRRLVVEARDHLVRALRAQEAAASTR
ncbi:MAG: aminopeptidase N, partial [Georgenia sp.]